MNAFPASPYNRMCSCGMHLVQAGSGRNVLGLALLLALSLAADAQSSCPVSYRSMPTARPLLLGGIYDGTCTAGCKDRNSYWGNICSFNNNAWDVCTPQQRQLGRDAIMNFSPGALKLQPCQLHQLLKGRTLWIIGDSYAQQLFKAVQCFLFDLWGSSECQVTADQKLLQPLMQLPKAPGNSKCIHLFGNGRVCILRVVLGTQLVNNNQFPSGGVLPYIQQKFSSPNDIFIVNFGVWHRKEGLPGMAQYSGAIKSLGEFYQRTKGRYPHLFFRETPSDHPKDMARNICLPYGGLTYNRQSGQVSISAATRVSSVSASIAAGSPFVAPARSIARNYGLPLWGANSWALSTTLYHQHVGHNQVPALDCLHYCNPGLPQLWLWELYQTLQSGTTGFRPLSVNDKSMLSCSPSSGF